jgi:ER lumen protein retaining receptor
MRYRTGGAQTTSSKLVPIVKESSIYITLSFLLAYRINYGSFSWSDSWSSHTSSLNWLSLVAQYFSIEDVLGINTHDASEVVWAASIFLAGVAGIPQYVTYYRHVTHKLDKLLMSVMAMISLGSFCYIPLWVAQFV